VVVPQPLTPHSVQVWLHGVVDVHAVGQVP
jgi:hypothetical protein